MRKKEREGRKQRKKETKKEDEGTKTFYTFWVEALGKRRFHTKSTGKNSRWTST